MARRLLCLTLLLTLLSLPAPAAAGDGPPTVVVGGRPVTYDVPPVIVHNRVMVPLRFTFQALGAEVGWDPGRQAVTARRGDVTLELTIGQPELRRNGERIALEEAPYLDGGRTLIPLRAVAEGLGARVAWDAATRTVTIDPAAGALPTVAVADGPTGGLQRIRAVPGGLLAAGYDRLFESADGGRTWQEIPVPRFEFGIQDVARMADGTLLVAPLDGPLHRSADQGRSWQPVAAVPRAISILVDGRTLYVAGRHVPADGPPLPAVYRSADGGATWSVSTAGFWPGRANAVAVDAADKQVLYAGVGDYDLARHGGGLFKSTDGGRTWQQASAGLPGWPLAVLADPAQGARVFARTPEGLYLSEDGAATWRPVPGDLWYTSPDGAVVAWQGPVNGLPVQGIAYDPAARLLVALTEGGTFVAPRAEGPWEQAGAGLPALRLRLTPPYGVAGRALFQGARFVGALPAADLTLAVSPARPDHLWALPGYQSLDGGQSWQPLPEPPAAGAPAVALDDQTLVARQVSGNGLLRSTDGGATWQPAGQVPAIVLAPGAGGHLWAATDRGVYISADAGRTWRWSGMGLPSLFVRDVSPDPADPAQAIALTLAGTACTRDGGGRWYPCGSGLPAPPYHMVARLARAPGGAPFLALDRTGVYTLAGESWLPLDMPGPEGLQDLAAMAGGQVRVSQFWHTEHRQIVPAVPAPALPPPPPVPPGEPRWRSPALAGAEITAVVATPSGALAAARDGRLYRSRDGGQTWAPAGALPGAAIPASALTATADGSFVYAPGDGTVYRTADAGYTWDTLRVADSEGSMLMTAVSPDPRDPSVLLAAYGNPLIMGAGSGVFRSVDGGTSWQRVYTPGRPEGQPPRRIGRLHRSLADPDLVYASGEWIAVSRDGGATWQDVGPGAIHATDAGGWLYGYVGDHLATSADGGATWQPLPAPAGAEPAAVTLYADGGRPGRLRAASQSPGGFWVSDDGGGTWTDLAAPVGRPPVRAAAPDGSGGWYLLLQSGLLLHLEP